MSSSYEVAGRQNAKSREGLQFSGLANQRRRAFDSAQVLAEEWSARGLDPKVLASVRTLVFSIGETPSK